MWSCRRHRSIEISIEKLPIGLSILKISMRFAFIHTREHPQKNYQENGKENTLFFEICELILIRS